MKAPPGTPYDCDAPGYSGEKPKTVWGSMVHGESPARMEPRGRWKISEKILDLPAPGSVRLALTE